MRRVACLLLALVLANGLDTNEEASKNRPVSKVITLLKDMLKTLQKEADEDEAVYDKMACWCETNDKAKTKAIADAEAQIEELENKIEELTAASARLNEEIAQLEEEVANNKAALATATKLREKELKEFTAEEAEMLETIAALKKAIAAIAKHNTFIQMPEVLASVRRSLDLHEDLLLGVMSRSDRKTLAGFLQSPQDFFDASPTFKQSYAPQSGEIYGILTQMQETFENNLASAQKEENQKQKDYEALKAAKTAEIKAGQEQIDKKTSELADVDERNAQAKTDLEDTKNTMSADEKYLMMLKEKCALTDTEWEERLKTRQLEMEAVSKALEILSGDDAMDTFTSTFNPVLLQKEAAATLKNQASKLLRAAADKLNSPRLAALATRVRLDAFTKVKKAIDDMIAQLLQEKEDEIKHKDFCHEEINNNEAELQDQNQKRMDLEAKIDEHKQVIKTLAAEIKALKEDVFNLQVALKRAGEDRELKSRDFQQTITDQRQSQKLLQGALDVLKGFYGLVQQEPAGPPPPAGFKEYKKNEQSGGVMSMIEQIINDAKAMEEDAKKAEDDDQKAYQDLVTETNAAIKADVKAITSKSEAKAKEEAELVETEQELDSTNAEIDSLTEYNGELHKSCDFVLKNFDIRQGARDEEIEALRQAKAILSGSKFELFLQS